MSHRANSIREALIGAGLAPDDAAAWTRWLEATSAEPEGERWRRCTRELLAPHAPFQAHRAMHSAIWDSRVERGCLAPAWVPSQAEIDSTNLAKLMRALKLASYDDLFAWSIEHREAFWAQMLRTLGIVFAAPPRRVLGNSHDVENPRWLDGARLNIAQSCFSHDAKSTAIVHAGESGEIRTMSLDDLRRLSYRVANALRDMGMTPGDAIAVDMLMTAESVAIYLGIVLAGCAVVSIADSFAAEEIAARLRIAGAKAVFTQDFIHRGGKRLPLYEKVVQGGASRCIVLPSDGRLELELRLEDVAWNGFLGGDHAFEPVMGEPDHVSNVLFSSGTTGDPKAIPWTHATPIKCAADGWLHHDIRPGDVVAWPTNLGWMMGPWLIYASLINGATIALYESAPNTRGFCEFVEAAKVTMLGVVPSLVKAWRGNNLTDGLDWSSIRCFSSTGECSNPDDMFWLMSRGGGRGTGEVGGYKPVIEYCGGTEIGGGYITSTCVQPNTPSTFTTPALGLDVVILDERGQEAEEGELFIIGPSIGLSTKLLNRDHHEVYYEGAANGPRGETLRRHGDEMRRLPNGLFQAMGRADDTMNLGGIKISSAEIERVLNEVTGVRETAAIAVPPPGGGPDRLVVYAVAAEGETVEEASLHRDMQKAISARLNPLFRIEQVSIVPSLPRTASNKVMRRVLRQQARLEPSPSRT